MSKQKYRVERDSMGELKVPEDALWGAQTQRAVENFPVSGLRMPRQFIRALGLIKASAAETNRKLGLLGEEIAAAVIGAAEQVASGECDGHFPIDVFQTGSGTSSNMNANEVIAHLASQKLGSPVHPNDHVNMGQSSNDVVPTAVHVSASLAVREDLLPALDKLQQTIGSKGDSLDGITKTGRTHLMDAMPVRFSQEMGGWASQIGHARERLEAVFPRLHQLAQGGTAVGTGINAHPDFADGVAQVLARRTGIPFRRCDNHFEALSSQDTALELSGQLKVLAASLMKIANDLRWMNSGPLAGLGEIALPALQPGSSIMPGKVNPVIPESVTQVAAQVIGNDAAIAIAAQSGNFQLNVMLPLVAHNLLQSLAILSGVIPLLADKALAGFTVNQERIDRALGRNPILVTALNSVIGYDQGAKIAKAAYQQGRPVLEVAREMTGLGEEELARLLDPATITRGGIVGR